MFNELTIRSMTINELERNIHMLGNISNEIILNIFLEKLDIANSKIEELEDEIAILKRA